MFSVYAPASSANLGPGFDCLAVALNRWLRVDVKPSNSDTIRDAGSPDLLGGANLVVEAMRATADRHGLALPGCEIRVLSDIPVARGLGSSAAAIAAGIRTAVELAGVALSDAEIIDIGGAMEGHADNVSAAVLGGLTAAIRTHEDYMAVQLQSELTWQPVVFIPESSSFTHEARQILPTSISVPDAAANIARAVLLNHAVQHGRADLLREAMHDRLHQPYRASIFAHLEPCVDAAYGAGAAGACLSGAGPAILAFADGRHAVEVGEAMRVAARQSGVIGESVVLRVPQRGCYVARDGRCSTARIEMSR